MKAYDYLNSLIPAMKPERIIQNLVSMGVVDPSAIRDIEFCIMKQDGKTIIEIADEWRVSEPTVSRGLKRFSSMFR